MATKDEIKQAAEPHWVRILDKAGIPGDWLDGKNHPCPMCGGHDRFSLVSLERGAVLCRQCFHEKNGDGIAAVAWRLGLNFREALKWVAREVGMQVYERVETKNPAPIGWQNEDYVYEDPEGRKHLLVKRRWDFCKGKKCFIQCHFDASGREVVGLPEGFRLYPYRLPQLIAAPPGSTIFIAEGEKCVHALEARGFLATTNPGGSGRSWGKMSHLRPALKGKFVVILADNDEPGVKHAEDTAQVLMEFVEEAKLLTFQELPPGGDIFDWFEAGRSPEELEQWVFETPRCMPKKAPEEPQEAPPTEDRYPFRDFKDYWNLEVKLPEAISEGWFYKRNFVTIAGDPKVGKTTFYLQLCLAYLHEIPFLGDPLTESGAVVILQADMQEARYVGMVHEVARGLGITDGEPAKHPFWVLSATGVDLEVEDVAKELEERIVALNPKLIILDPVRSYHPSNDNDADVVQKVWNFGVRLRNRLDCLEIWVDHVTKPGISGRGHVGNSTAARGSGVKGAINDGTIAMYAQEDGRVKCQISLRDAEGSVKMLRMAGPPELPNGRCLVLSEEAPQEADMQGRTGGRPRDSEAEESICVRKAFENDRNHAFSGRELRTKIKEIRGYEMRLDKLTRILLFLSREDPPFIDVLEENGRQLYRYANPAQGDL